MKKKMNNDVKKMNNDVKKKKINNDVKKMNNDVKKKKMNNDVKTWFEALKEWNKTKGGKYLIPKKASKEYNEIKALMK
jgi:predicted RND superfamily exporter protein